MTINRGNTVFCKKWIWIVVFLLVLAICIAETEEKIAQFTVQNAAPNAPYNFSPTTTHNKTQVFTWTEGSDDNYDNISTYICITNDLDVDNCTVVDTNTFTPMYAFTNSELNWDYTWGNASRLYYVKLVPNDGTDNGTANDTIYFTLTDAIPTLAGQTSDAASDGSKDVGEQISFFMTSHTDTDADDNHSLRVCKTDAINQSADCTGGEWCTSSYSTNTNLTCQYSITAAEQNLTYSAYFFVCDCPPDDDECPGQCSAGNGHTFYVNHAPNATDADILPNNPETTDDLNCSHTFNDGDADTESSTYRWFQDGILTAYTTYTLSSSATAAGETWICEITPIDEHGFAGTPVNSTSESTENSPPDQPTNFEVQDGAASYDSIVRDTHDVTPHLRWNTSDPDSNPVTTYVCIASTSGNRDNNICDMFSSSEADGDVAAVSGLSYSGTSVTYYVRLTPNDGSDNGTALDTDITIINSQPSQPSGLSPTTTHSQTPTLSWTATDADDGSNNHWPADTLTYHIRVGTSYGDGTYLNSDDADKNGITVTNPIPWGIPGEEWANNTVYASIWSSDSSLNSTQYNATLTLYDYLPKVTNIEMTDSGAYSSCTFASCALNPVEHSNTTVAVRVTINDTDDDCDTYANAHLILCRVNDPDACNETENNHYSWEIDNKERSGNICTLTLSTNKTATDNTPEFFRAPDNGYKLFVNASSQAGRRQNDANAIANWTYGTLKAIDYPTTITMGNDNVQLNQWNPGTSLAVMTNWGNDIIDITWNISDPVGDEDTWTLNGTDIMIDDDNSTSLEEGQISPVYLNATEKQFQPTSGLNRCLSWGCDSGLNETLNTYYHILPPLGLKAGTYNSTITITIS